MSKSSKFNINPTDLLLTNSFISNTNKVNKAKKYINKNLLENSNINLIKNFNSPWPVKYNNITKPILSDTTQDVSEEKYRKVKKTNIFFSSFYRNILINPIANNYTLNLGREFNNVFKIEIVDFSIEKSLISINNNNNMFGWEYPTFNSLKKTNSEYVLYPTKYNTISVIPGVTSDLINCEIIYDQDSSQSVYTTKVNKEYCTTEDLRLNFEQSLSNVKIDIKNTDDPSFIKLKYGNILFTDPTYPNETKASKLLYQYPYRTSYNDLGPLDTSNEALRSINANFHLTINENNQKCYIVNRKDLYPIIMIQTFRYAFTTKLLVSNDQIITDNIVINTDLFQRYIPCIYDNAPSEHGIKLLTPTEYENGYFDSGGYKNDSYETRFPENGENILITFKLPFYDLNELLTNETKLKNALINSWISYPIVFTDLPDMGALNADILNNTPFFYNILYHLNIYTNTHFPRNRVENTNPLRDPDGNEMAPLSWYRNSSLPPFVSTFYMYDLFQVKCSENSPLYVRFSCKLSTGNINDRPLNLNGSPLFSNIDLAYIFNDQFKNLINSQDEKIVCCDVSGCDISGCSIGKDIGGHFNYGVYFNNIDSKPLMGRAYPIKLLPNTIEFESKYTNYIGYKNSILDILGFINSENSFNKKVLSMKQPYRWVNTNFQDIIVPSSFNYQYNLKLDQLFNIQLPQNKLNLQYDDNKYYISSNNFLYIKLFINNSDSGFLSDDFLIASSINTSVLDKNSYYNVDFYNENSQNIDTSNKINNLSNITAVVNINNIPSKKTYVKLNKTIDFNNKPIDKLNSFKIQLILPNGELFMQNESHYMNIIIYEKINVLKDTLLNTKDNTTTVTGIASIYDV